MSRPATSSAYTPGPWTVWYTPGKTLYINSPKRNIAALCHDAKPKEVAATAHLIAASPDLLAGCKTALDALNQIPMKRLYVGTSYDVASLLSRVIDKAEGRNAPHSSE